MWGGGDREGCATQRRQVVILQHLTMLMDSDGNRIVTVMWFVGGTWGRGKPSKHNVLHVIVD